MVEERDNLGTGINPIDMPPVSLVPLPDLSNLDVLQPANPDLSTQAELPMDMTQPVDMNMPAPGLSDLAQAELPPPPLSSVTQLPESPNVPSVLPQGMGQMPSVLPQGMGQSNMPQSMGQKLPLFMSGAVMIDSSGGNIERMSRAWSLLKTPVFSTVQSNPIMQRTHITNRIGRVANRNGATVTATKLRVI